jgi:GT2 family glycosyltransferase
MSERISVVIPSIRPNLLHKAIRSIINQSTKPFEVIVVTPHQVNFQKAQPILKVLKTERVLNPGAARNAGAKIAQGEIIVFLDDDCQADREVLKEMVKELDERSVGAVSGRVLGCFKGYFARCFDFTAFSPFFKNQREEKPISSAALGMRKEVFEEVGGFDESLRMVEDGDLSFRLKQKGYQTIYQPKIKVWHNHGRKTLFDFLGYLYFSGRQAGLILEKRYPQFSFRNRLFSQIAHPFWYLFLILPLAFCSAIIMTARNFQEYPKILLLFPGLFLGQVCYYFGVWQWLKDENKA